VIARHLNELMKDLLLPGRLAVWYHAPIASIKVRGATSIPMAPTAFRFTTFSSLSITVAPLSSSETNTPVLLPARFVLRQALRAFVAETNASQVIGGKAETHEGPLNRFPTLLAELQVVLR
jgi:hypothetical protein